MRHLLIGTPPRCIELHVSTRCGLFGRASCMAVWSQLFGWCFCESSGRCAIPCDRSQTVCRRETIHAYASRHSKRCVATVTSVLVRVAYGTAQLWMDSRSRFLFIYLFSIFVFQKKAIFFTYFILWLILLFFFLFCCCYWFASAVVCFVNRCVEFFVSDFLCWLMQHLIFGCAWNRSAITLKVLAFARLLLKNQPRQRQGARSVFFFSGCCNSSV